MLNYPKGILRYFSCPLLSIILMHLLSCLLLENKLFFTLILMAKFSLKKLSRILSMLLPCRLLVILLFLKLDKADSQYLIWKIMSFLTLNTCLPGKNQIQWTYKPSMIHVFFVCSRQDTIMTTVSFLLIILFLQVLIQNRYPATNPRMTNGHTNIQQRRQIITL